jgi:oxidoreductase
MTSNASGALTFLSVDYCADVAVFGEIGLTALILGATGQTGRHLLRELLESPKYTRVLEVGRRVTPQEQLPESTIHKLEQRVINFEKLDEARLGEGPGYDVVYVTCVTGSRSGMSSSYPPSLGTTKKDAGSAEMFEKIDRE